MPRSKPNSEKPAAKRKAPPKPRPKKAPPKRRVAPKAKRRAKPTAKPRPAPRPTPDPAAYQRHKVRAAAYQAEQAKAGADIGPIKDIADVARRERCRGSLRIFIETYNPESFTLAWSDTHLAAIARIEEAATLGALYAYAMPRGSGKTSIARMAALWAVSYALRRYVFTIGATASKAKDSLAAIKMFIRFLPDYAADFPEISQAVQHIGGAPNRAGNQHCQGQPTMIKWAQDCVILPTVPPPANWPKHWPLRPDGMVPTSGAVVSASGLTGESIRGSLLTQTTGEAIRPDLVLLDDPQTPKSARSPGQNETREQLVSADVLGMAGPGKTISAVMPCTVLAAGDFIDRILDRSKHPLWRGERTQMLRSMPANLDAWEPYFDLYRACAQREPPDFAEANAYYAAHRAELDAGADPSWPARKLDTEVSAVQHAMHLYCRDPRAFAAEYQNDPLPLVEESAEELTADEIAARVNRHDRGVVPAGAVQLTAMIDVQQAALYYAVCAWEDGFTGAVVDYGTWPDQQRSYFQLRDVRRTLQQATGAQSVEGAIYAGLTALTGQLLGREWKGEGGAALRIGRCLVDANWGEHTELVYRFCRQSPHAALLMPSHGKGIGPDGRPMSEWQKRPGEQAGHNWRVSSSERGLRKVVFDSNWWKTFAHSRLAVDMGGRGALTLFGDKPATHRLLADHLTAEYRTPTEGRGRKVDVWAVRPDRRDNHWLDCLVGCCVAASMLGVALAEHQQPANKAPRLPFAERQRRARQRQKGAA